MYWEILSGTELDSTSCTVELLAGQDLTNQVDRY